ncbi:filament-like plant protein isoform X2 [Neltuma alba]|nr:filament-like plant protein isoform X2 [Prosopis alba]
MDRRSWLWRRKSSDKSLAETESSGSMSSHSERFFDDQAYPTQTSSTSPAVMSKVASNEEEVTDVKILKEQLSAALLSISVKEDLIKQHANVAEEAISGWEKAEDDVLSFKQQLDAAKKNNSHLEERVSQLDMELKECAGQLRQAREEQEQKIHEAVANNSVVWESKKSELEGKVAELEAQLQTAKVETTTSISCDLKQKLEAVEKENAGLKLELQSRLEEIDFMITEKDLSAKAAETASKQHLESIMKIANLEAEYRRLKAIAHRTCSANDHVSLTASSVFVESFTDSLSESGERLHTVENDTNECEPSRSNSWASALVTEFDQFMNEKTAGKNRMAASIEINLMDDFLEMERLAALPDTESGSSFLETEQSVDQPKSDQNTAKTDVESLIHRNSELEEQIKKMETNKLGVEMELTECREQLHASQMQTKDAELKIAELQTQLDLTMKSNQEAYEELEEAKTKNEVAGSKLSVLQTEVQELVSKIGSMEEQIQKERALSAEYNAKREKLEDELSRIKHDAQLQREAEILDREGITKELKLKREKELSLAASRLAECQRTIASLGQRLESLATLEDLPHDSQKPVGLTSEAKQSPKSADQLLKSRHSDLNFQRRDFVSSISRNPYTASEKSRSGFGKSAPRSKSVSRAGRH